MGIKIRCLRCMAVIQSLYRHDFRECTCGDVYIDGGNDYTRIGCNPNGSYEEVKVDNNEDHERSRS